MSKRRRLKDGLVNKFYGKLAALAALHRIGIQLGRDPLHHRYEVNRHGIQVVALGDSSDRIRMFLVSDLNAEGWKFESKYDNDCYTMNYRGTTVAVFVGTVHGKRFDLSLFVLDLLPAK